LIDILKKIFKPNKRLDKLQKAVFKQYHTATPDRTNVLNSTINFTAKLNGREWYNEDILIVVNGDGYLVYLMKGQEVTKDTTIDNRNDDTVVVDTPHLMSLIDFLSAYCGKNVRFSISEKVSVPNKFCGSTGK
tara:strand:+ start:535 stop:933 length:399 start_codon:yes stop_codon:yes gene_type:complete